MTLPEPEDLRGPQQRPGVARVGDAGEQDRGFPRPQQGVRLLQPEGQDGDEPGRRLDVRSARERSLRER